MCCLDNITIMMHMPLCIMPSNLKRQQSPCLAGSKQGIQFHSKINTVMPLCDCNRP